MLDADVCRSPIVTGSLILVTMNVGCVRRDR